MYVHAAGKQTPLCYPSSVTSARAMMLFNLGSAYCLRSEYEKARKCLHQVNINSRSASICLWRETQVWTQTWCTYLYILCSFNLTRFHDKNRTCYIVFYKDLKKLHSYPWKNVNSLHHESWFLTLEKVSSSQWSNDCDLCSSGCIYGQHQGDPTWSHPAGSLLRATERSDTHSHSLFETVFE